MTHLRSIASAAIAAAAVFVAGALSPAWAQKSPEAEAYVQSIADQAFGLVNTGDAANRAAIDKIIRENVDLRRVGMFSLGHYARQLSADQKTAYLDMFNDFAVSRYTRLLLRYTDQRLVVQDSLKRSERDIIVWTRVLGDPEFDGLVLQWRVLVDRDGGYAVLDVSAEGIWLGVQQREEFTSIIANNGGPSGGGVERLLAMMQAETSQSG